MSTDNTVQGAQRLRLKRFAMSVATFGVVLVATLLITSLGLGDMNRVQWETFIGLGVFGVATFFLLFYSGANLHFPEPSLTREQIVFWSFWGLFALYWLPAVRPIILLFYLPPFTFGILILTRRQYLGVVGCVLGLYSALLILEYVQHPETFNVQYQLFLFALFGILLIWFAFFGGYVAGIRRRLRAQKDEIQRAHEEIRTEMEGRMRIQIEKDNLIVELQEALRNVRTLNGLLPICASCKKIRDDKGYWNQIECYIREHSNAEFSHGICPDCAKKLYPRLRVDGKPK